MLSVESLVDRRNGGERVVASVKEGGLLEREEEEGVRSKARSPPLAWSRERETRKGKGRARERSLTRQTRAVVLALGRKEARSSLEEAVVVKLVVLRG